MTRIAGMILCGLLVAGCATEASVKKQLDPLADRITALEQQQASTTAKLNAQDAELAALRKSNADNTASAARAEQAAKLAAAAAERAESAAEKSTKAFELAQVKGARKQ